MCTEYFGADSDEWMYGLDGFAMPKIKVSDPEFIASMNDSEAKKMILLLESGRGRWPENKVASTILRKLRAKLRKKGKKK